MVNNEDQQKKEAQEAFEEFTKFLAERTSEVAMKQLSELFTIQDGELEKMLAHVGLACHNCILDKDADGIDLHIEGKQLVAALENAIAFAMSMYKRTQVGKPPVEPVAEHSRKSPDESEEKGETE